MLKITNSSEQTVQTQIRRLFRETPEPEDEAREVRYKNRKIFYDIVPGNDIEPCIIIDNPLVYLVMLHNDGNNIYMAKSFNTKFSISK